MSTQANPSREYRDVLVELIKWYVEHKGTARLDGHLREALAALVERLMVNGVLLRHYCLAVDEELRRHGVEAFGGLNAPDELPVEAVGEQGLTALSDEQLAGLALDVFALHGLSEYIDEVLDAGGGRVWFEAHVREADRHLRASGRPVPTAEEIVRIAESRSRPLMHKGKQPVHPPVRFAAKTTPEGEEAEPAQGPTLEQIATLVVNGDSYELLVDTEVRVFLKGAVPPGTTRIHVEESVHDLRRVDEQGLVHEILNVESLPLLLESVERHNAAPEEQRIHFTPG